MFSFLNDSELYGAPLVTPAQTAPSRPGHQQQAAAGTPQPAAPSPAEPPALTLDVFVKAIAHLEKRFLSLEERLLLYHQMLETRLEERRDRGGDLSWLKVLAILVGVALLFYLFFRRLQPPSSAPRFPAEALPQLQAAPPVAPPTPIFVLPSSFVGR